MRKAVIIDIDGTISDCRHRIEHWKSKDYKKFDSLAPEDPPMANVVTIVKALKESGFEIIFLTGRHKRNWNQTVEWLFKHTGLGFADYTLHMREEDGIPDHVLKKATYVKEIATNYDVKLVMEDRKRVVEMWTKMKLAVIQLPDNFKRKGE